MMLPLVIADLLTTLGVPGSIALVVVALVGLWHWRSITQSLQQLGLISRVLGVVAVLAVIAAVGLIPGVTLDVAVGVVVDTVAAVVDVGERVLDVVLGAVR